MALNIESPFLRDLLKQIKGQVNQAKDKIAKTLLGKVDSLLVVDMGSNLKIVNVGFKQNISLTALNITELPKDDSRDKVIIETLKKFIRDNNIEHKSTILKPHLDALLIKHLKLPVMPKSELQDAVKWQIKDELSFDISQAVIDFLVLGETLKEDGAKTLDCICAAAKEQEVRHQVSLLKKAELECLGLNLLPFGYASLVEKFELAKDQSLAILHLEEDKCFLVLFRSNKLEFYREVPLSIDRLRESLKGTLVTDTGKVELSEGEIEELLFKIGIPGEEQLNFKGLSSIQILSMLRTPLERLAAEIKRSLVYCSSQFQISDIKKIYLAGHGAEIPNLAGFLNKELSLEVTKLNLQDKFKISPQVKVEFLPQSYASFGLALNYKQGINLLPYDLRTEKIERYEKFSLRWFIITASLLLIVFYLFARAGISLYQKRLNNATLQLNVLSEIREEKVRIEEFDKFISGVKNSVFPVDSLLKQLSMIVQSDILLDSLSIELNSKSGFIIGVVKSIKESPDLILTNFIQELEKTPYFTSTSIASVEKEEAGEVRFKISFKLP